jgi:hypothetical protein
MNIVHDISLLGSAHFLPRILGGDAELATAIGSEIFW